MKCDTVVLHLGRDLVKPVFFHKVAQRCQSRIEAGCPLTEQGVCAEPISSQFVFFTFFTFLK